MSKIFVCQIDDLDEGEALKVDCDVNGIEALAVFNNNGEFFAMNDRCSHGNASMSEGYLEDDGTVEYIDCELVDGHLVWEADSFSYYAVVAAATEAQQTLPQETGNSAALLSGQGKTSPAWLIWVWVALAFTGVALLGFAVYAKKRASRK